ncbi:MAG: AI-2E family transporter [Leptospirales bacterium]|nr:AI-2E family transporter [Leptospirales bacterium]
MEEQSMPVSLEKRVWFGMALIGAALTFFFALGFYFYTILLSLALGLALITLVRKLRGDLSSKLDPYRLSERRRQAHTIVIAALWIISAVYLLLVSLEDLNQALDRLRPGSLSWQTFYDQGLRPFLPREVRTSAYFQEIFQSTGDYLGALLQAKFAQIPTVLFTCLLIIPPMLFQYFRSGQDLRQRMALRLPEEFRSSFEQAWLRTGAQLNDYLTVAVAEATVVGAISCLGFYIGGVKGWLILGVLAGLANMAPVFGPIIGAIPPVMISLALRDPTAALIALATSGFAHAVDNLVLVPVMVARKVQVNPLAAMLLLLTGAAAFGAIGIVFAVPVYLVYRIILTESYGALVRVYDPGIAAAFESRQQALADQQAPQQQSQQQQQ